MHTNLRKFVSTTSLTPPFEPNPSRHFQQGVSGFRTASSYVWIRGNAARACPRRGGWRATTRHGWGEPKYATPDDVRAGPERQGAADHQHPVLLTFMTPPGQR